MLEIKIVTPQTNKPTKNVTEEFWNLHIRNKDVVKLTPFVVLCKRIDSDDIVKFHFVKHTNKTVLCLENRNVYVSNYYIQNRILRNVSKYDDSLLVVGYNEIEMVLSIKGK